MNNKVQIIADELGNVIRVSNNPDYGYVRLSQNTFQINNGFMQKKSVTALLHGKLEDLKEMGIQNKTEITGKIVVKEQLTPFREINPEQDYKIAGATGIVCSVNDKPIYRKTVFTSDVTAEDVLLDHTNGDDIREANGNSFMGNKTKQVAKNVTATLEEAFDIEDSSEITNSISTNDSDDFIEESTAELNEEIEIEIEDSTFEL